MALVLDEIFGKQYEEKGDEQIKKEYETWQDVVSKLQTARETYNNLEKARDDALNQQAVISFRNELDGLNEDELANFKNYLQAAVDLANGAAIQNPQLFKEIPKSAKEAMDSAIDIVKRSRVNVSNSFYTDWASRIE